MRANFQDYTNLDLPAPVSAPWRKFPPYHFVGGNNDPDSLPIDLIADACDKVLRREGRTLATYSLESGPQGYLPLRDFLVTKLKNYAGIECTTDEILLTSGSLQAIDLINEALVNQNSTVIVEESNYGGVLSRLNRLQVNLVPVSVDQDGMITSELESTLADLKQRGIKPAYIYSIPTVHNPTGTIMSVERRQHLIDLAVEYDIPVFEDECYADLVWAGERPPSLYAMDKTARVIHIGSFSKTIAPALRVGYVVADWSLIGQLLSLKTDAGSGSLEQMLLGEYCKEHFDQHVASLNRNLKAKLDTLCACIDREFGTTAEYTVPPGGIFVWIKLPAQVDTRVLEAAAAKEGVAINPGQEWSLQKDASEYLRLCFASPDQKSIEDGIAKLAEVCHREFGVPALGHNQSRA